MSRQEQDAAQAAWHHHEQLMRQQEIEQAIKNCEHALREFWMAQDEKLIGQLWPTQTP